LADDLSAISALRTQCSRTSSATTCAPGYDVQHDNDRKNRDLPLFIGFGAAGLVALGAAVVGIVRTPSDQAAPTTTAVATPWFAPGGGGAALSGRF
jgi:hypothetical protein